MCPLEYSHKNEKYRRNDTFEPFEDKDILTKSQSNKGKWD
jgi:hypothetical protein